MKKLIVGVSIGICLFSLAGCKDQKQTKGSESKNSVKISETYSTTKRTGNKEKTRSHLKKNVPTSSENNKETSETATVWTEQKASELRTFMKNWGNTMGQSYKEYQPGQNVNFYGLNLPDDVLGTKQPIAVNDKIVSAEWSASGKSSAEYTIVSVYSDAETASYAVRHVYFFGFNKDQPIVLVSMQNQGMPDGALHFTPTENSQLNTGFQNIAGGTSASQPTQDQSTQNTDTWSSIDEAIQFYEAVYKNTSNEISKNIVWENYDRKCWSLVEQNGNRLVLHWANISGAGGSYDEFIKNGETTELIVYDGNASYPASPGYKYTIRNTDHLVIKTEQLWK